METGLVLLPNNTRDAYLTSVIRNTKIIVVVLP